MTEKVEKWEGGTREGERRDREQLPLYLLLHSSTGLSRQAWAGPKPGAWDSIWVPHNVAVMPSLEQQQEVEVEWLGCIWYSDMEAGVPRTQPTCCSPVGIPFTTFKYSFVLYRSNYTDILFENVQQFEKLAEYHSLYTLKNFGKVYNCIK